MYSVSETVVTDILILCQCISVVTDILIPIKNLRLLRFFVYLIYISLRLYEFMKDSILNSKDKSFVEELDLMRLFY